MKALPWFRMYTDFLDDPKIIGLAFEDQRHFIAVLALKSSGVLEVDCQPKILDRIVAQRLWIDYAIIEDVKKRLIDAGLIDLWWQPLAWDKRQMPSDFDPTGAERQRRYRNALRNGASDATVTPPEEIRVEEKRVDKKKESADAPPIGVSLSVWQDFKAIRKTKKAALTQTAINKIRAQADKAGVSLQSALETCCERGWASFNADWLADKQKAYTPPSHSGKKQNKQEALETRNRAIAEAWVTGEAIETI